MAGRDSGPPDACPAPPYPADTRSKGWRLEVDPERLYQSDTWALCPSEAKPWLTLLIITSWTQAPCGSLPVDASLIAARLGMPLKLFTRHQAVLLRGWWRASDGRLYHPVVTERVLGMLTSREAERSRKANYRAKQSHGGDAVSHGTPIGQTPDSTGRDATSTSTSTSVGIPAHVAEVKDQGAHRTRARVNDGDAADSLHPLAPIACKAMRAAGLAKVDQADPMLNALLHQGITVAELQSATEDAVRKGKSVAYALQTAIGRRRDAAAIGVMPSFTNVESDPNSKASIEARAASLGIGKWDAMVEQWPSYRARVIAEEAKAEGDQARAAA